MNNFQQSPRITSVSNSHLEQTSPIISQPPSIEGMHNGISIPAASPTIAGTPTSSSPSNSSHHQPSSVLSNVNSSSYSGKVNTPNSSGQVSTVSTTIKREVDVEDDDDNGPSDKKMKTEHHGKVDTIVKEEPMETTSQYDDQTMNSTNDSGDQSSEVDSKSVKMEDVKSKLNNILIKVCCSAHRTLLFSFFFLSLVGEPHIQDDSSASTSSLNSSLDVKPVISTPVAASSSSDKKEKCSAYTIFSQIFSRNPM
jgi:hypothetical protein